MQTPCHGLFIVEDSVGVQRSCDGQVGVPDTIQFVGDGRGGGVVKQIPVQLLGPSEQMLVGVQVIAFGQFASVTIQGIVNWGGGSVIWDRVREAKKRRSTIMFLFVV